MNESELKKLIEKYYEGKSTTEEEQELRIFFSKDILFPGYEAEREIFRHYYESENIPVPSSGFESKILQAVDDLERRSFRKRYITVLSSAAAILFLIGAWFFLIHEKKAADTYTNPEIAYAETMKILYEVSLKLNEGTEALKPVVTLANTTLNGIRTIDKSLSVINGGLKKAGIFVHTGTGGDDKKENKLNN